MSKQFLTSFTYDIHSLENLPDQPFHHGDVEFAVDPQLVGIHVWPELLVITDHDQVFCALTDGRNQARLENFCGLFDQNNPVLELPRINLDFM